MPFKSQWEPSSAHHHIPQALIVGMVNMAYPHKLLKSTEVLDGGCANLNIKVYFKNNATAQLLRIYLRDKDAAYREQRLHSLLKTNMPIPEIYYSADIEGYRFALTEFLPGIPLRTLLLSDKQYDMSEIMWEIGKTLSKISAKAYKTPGFFDIELQPISSSEGIYRFAINCLRHQKTEQYLDTRTIERITNHLIHNQALLSHINQENHLTHGDFDPANILVDNVNESWVITGVLDWEFVHAGSSLWDIANMLRYAHKMPAEFEISFTEGFTKEKIYPLPKDWKISAHLLNMTSLLDLLIRAPENATNQITDICDTLKYHCTQIKNQKTNHPSVPEVIVIEHQNTWTLAFEEEVFALEKIFRESIIEIHHIGSTSIQGLASKPIIDIIPVVRDITKVDALNAKMEKLGYTAKGEHGILFRRFFQKKTPTLGYNIHVFEASTPDVERHLLFRDWMRTHAEDRMAYGTLKKSLAKQSPNDITGYCLSKDAFVAAIDSITGFDGYRIVLALTDLEWKTYYQLGGRKEHATRPPLILYKGTLIVGIANIAAQEEVGTISYIATEPASCGHGTYFLEKIETWLKQRQCTQVRTKQNQRFFIRNGYHLSHRKNDYLWKVL